MTNLSQNLEVIQNELDQVSERLVAELNNTPPVLSPVMNHLATAKGKYMRAAIIVAVAKALKPKSVPKVIDMAVATELMHLSTLVHDDVIDDAPMRRGIKSVQSKYGKKLAVISGDYLFTKCFVLIAKNNNKRMADFSRAIAVICLGEALQQQYCGNPDITARHYFKIVAGKTAAMFSLAMYGAATECGADKKTAQRLARAGYYLGVVFQMVDDCLDYEGEESKTKKSLYIDLEQGIITLPLICAMNKEPRLKELFKGSMSDADKLDIINTVRRCGGVAETKELALKYYNLCKKWLDRAFDTKDSALIMGILDSVYYRES